MKKYLPLVIISLAVFAGSCAQMAMVNPMSGNNSGGSISDAMKSRILNGCASASDLRVLIQKFHDEDATVTANGPTEGAIIVVPQTGKLLLTLRDNDAGWRSELFMTIGDQTVQLFSDTRQGPLNNTTEYAYLAGTPVGFFLVTHSSSGAVFTNRADSIQCRVDYFASVPKWVLNFEDVPSGGGGGLTPDWDYNDAVIEVQMAPDPVVDISECVSVSIDYLDPAGYTPDGLTIYYIGETMSYNVNIDVSQTHPLLEGTPFTVYAIHEYLEAETCYRWWYPGEPKEITVQKGDLLPGDGNPYSWTGVSLPVGRTVLNGSSGCSLAAASGNDQTHVLIVRENAQGQIEMTIYDNPETGVFDPPPPQTVAAQ
jgi:hypothetical protein